MIKHGNPVRETFAACSTGAPCGHWRGRVDYYSRKSCAISTFNAELHTYGLRLDYEDLSDFDGDMGRTVVTVCSKYGDKVGYAVFIWHRISNGRYEFIGYLD